MPQTHKEAKKYLVIVMFAIVYMIPIHFLKSIDINIENYLYAISILSYYLYHIYIYRTTKTKDIILIFLIIYFVLLYKDITFSHLLGLIVLDKLLDNIDYYVNYILKSRILIISLLFSVTYSIIYFGYQNRYIYTGYKEINQSAMSLFFLFLMIRIKHKMFGNILLLLGVFSLSKTYLLSIIIFFAAERIKNKKSINRFINLFIDFRMFAVLSCLILIFVSQIFISIYKKGELKPYKSTGIGRYTTMFDYSNYFRFTTNTNLIEIYKDEPKKLVTGLTDDEFYSKAVQIVTEKEGLYRKIKPHNYFFSYLKTYGIFSIFIFYYIHTLIKKIYDISNQSILLALYSYIIFLGSGLTGYWIFISFFTLMVYKKSRCEHWIVLTKK